jgi:hypothetical protein
LRYLHLIILLMFCLGVPYATEWLLCLMGMYVVIYSVLNFQLIIGTRTSELGIEAGEIQSALQTVIMNFISFAVIFMSDYYMFAFIGVHYIISHALTVTMSVLVYMEILAVVDIEDIEEDDPED